MGKLAGVKLERDTLGRVKKVTLDMKYHAQFIKDYLDRLKIQDAQKDADFVAWDDVKTELDKKHGINAQRLHGRPGAQGRKTA